jgi:hypothetical protein
MQQLGARPPLAAHRWLEGILAHRQARRSSESRKTTVKTGPSSTTAVAAGLIGHVVEAGGHRGGVDAAHRALL